MDIFAPRDNNNRRARILQLGRPRSTDQKQNETIKGYYREIHPDNTLFYLFLKNKRNNYYKTLLLVGASWDSPMFYTSFT